MASRSAGLPFILVTLLLDTLGVGIIIPVLPALVTSFGGGDVSESSGTFGWFVAVYALMQFIFAPMLGILSDMFGRRPVLLLSLLGAGLDYVFMAVAPGMQWLFVGRVISGVTAANVTAINAYVADVSPPEKRAQNFGLIGAVWGIGFILGPAIGGAVATFGPRAPFWAAAVMSLLNTAYGALVLPESLPRESRKPWDWANANPFAPLAVLKKYPLVLSLAGAQTMTALASQVYQSTWVLFTTFRFHWTELQNGISLSVVGITTAVVQGGLVGVLVKKLGERTSLLTGTVISAAGFVAFGLSSEGWMMYAAIVGSSLSGLAFPSSQALMTRSVGPQDQGTVQGAVQSLQALTGIVGPVLFTQLFGYFTSSSAPVQLPGVAFFASAAFVGVALMMTLRAFARLPAQ